VYKDREQVLGVIIVFKKIILIVVFLALFESAANADWKQFNSDYADAVNALNATSGCFMTYYLNENPSWLVRLNVTLSGLCEGCQSSGGYGLTYSYSPNSGANWYVAYCGEWYGNYRTGTSSSLTKHYMGIYQPDTTFTITANGCNNDASFVVMRGDSDALTGFDNSLISGINSDLISQGRLVGIKEINSATGYQYIYVDMCTGELYWVCNGNCDGADDPEVWWEGAPGPSPTFSPTPTPSFSPIPTPTASSSWTPENYPSPVPNVGTLTGSISLDTNGSSTTGSFSATIQMPDTEKLSPYFQSGQSEQNKVNEISNMEISDEVPDVGQKTELEYGWLDTLLDGLSSHPILGVINGSHIVSSGELCELSCVIWGKTVVFSFCEWEYWFDYLGYFIFVFSLYYAVVIVFLKGS